MNIAQSNINHYLDYCKTQKCLDTKTLNAYKIDLKQFYDSSPIYDITDISTEMIENYIGHLHKNYKPKTAKRKIASIKAFFHYLEYKDLIDVNPFNKIQVKFREPVTLPKTIPLHNIEKLLSTIYSQQKYAKTSYQKRNSLRDAAVIELLFATGIRISELCTLKINDINLHNGNILIHGKGNKERIIQIGNMSVIKILNDYKAEFYPEMIKCNHFFTNQSGRPLNDQAVRRMINKYSKIAAIDLHITPHMFRHTFATSLLEEDVDIRYIQKMLGHSSINITEIYTHVTMSKQKNILTTKHPRNKFNI